jgi:hypothetical protein
MQTNDGSLCLEIGSENFSVQSGFYGENFPSSGPPASAHIIITAWLFIYLYILPLHTHKNGQEFSVLPM